MQQSHSQRNLRGIQLRQQSSQNMKSQAGRINLPQFKTTPRRHHPLSNRNQQKSPSHRRRFTHMAYKHDSAQILKSERSDYQLMKSNNYIGQTSLSLIQKSIRIKKQNKYDVMVGKDKQVLKEAIHGLSSYYAYQEKQDEVLQLAYQLRNRSGSHTRKGSAAINSQGDQHLNQHLNQKQNQNQNAKQAREMMQNLEPIEIYNMQPIRLNMQRTDMKLLKVCCQGLIFPFKFKFHNPQVYAEVIGSYTESQPSYEKNDFITRMQEFTVYSNGRDCTHVYLTIKALMKLETMVSVYFSSKNTTYENGKVKTKSFIQKNRESIRQLEVIKYTFTDLKNYFKNSTSYSQTANERTRSEISRIQTQNNNMYLTIEQNNQVGLTKVPFTDRDTEDGRNAWRNSKDNSAVNPFGSFYTGGSTLPSENKLIASQYQTYSSFRQKIFSQIEIARSQNAQIKKYQLDKSRKGSIIQRGIERKLRIEEKEKQYENWIQEQLLKIQAKQFIIIFMCMKILLVTRLWFKQKQEARKPEQIQKRAANFIRAYIWRKQQRMAKTFTPQIKTLLLVRKGLQMGAVALEQKLISDNQDYLGRCLYNIGFKCIVMGRILNFQRIIKIIRSRFVHFMADKKERVDQIHHEVQDVTLALKEIRNAYKLKELDFLEYDDKVQLWEQKEALYLAYELKYYDFLKHKMTSKILNFTENVDFDKNIYQHLKNNQYFSIVSQASQSTDKDFIKEIHSKYLAFQQVMDDHSPNNSSLNPIDINTSLVETIPGNSRNNLLSASQTNGNKRQSKKSFSKKYVRRTTLKTQMKDQKVIQKGLKRLKSGHKYVDKLSKNLEMLREKQFVFKMDVVEIIAFLWSLYSHKMLLDQQQLELRDNSEEMDSEKRVRKQSQYKKGNESPKELSNNKYVQYSYK